jgi:integrase
VDAAKPASKRYWVWDDSLRGFGVRIYPSGVKTYYFQFRLDGQRTPRKMKLGVHGNITADDARRKAKDAALKLAFGEDPRAERAALRSGLTVAGACERFLEEHSRRRKKPAGVRNDELISENHVVPALGELPLRKLERRHVAKLHGDLHATPIMANRVRAFVSKLVSWAQEVGEYPEDRPNPCRLVKPYPETKRHAELDAKELGRLGKALDAAGKDDMQRPAVRVIRGLLLTGCRLGEVQSLRWSQVDLDRGLLRLVDSKTGARTVVLGDAAVAFFDSLGKPDIGDGWVFPSPWKRNVPVGEVRKVWYEVRKAAELGGLRLHDLRHVVASEAVSGGVSLYVTGRLLGHTQASTTARYAHVADRAAKAAADQVSGAIAAALAADAVAGREQA